MRRWWLPALIAVLGGVTQAQPRELELVYYAEPVVPRLEIDASVVVALTIRANGRVADAVALTATNRVLAESARDAVLQWRFRRDATFGTGRNAEPSKILRREVVELVFKRGGVVQSLSHRDSAKSFFPPDYAPVVRLVQAAELDPPLARVERPPNEDTANVIRALGVDGSVLVSFVVDETGAVRVPIAERASDERLVDAALAQVGGWRYAPPTHDAEPVLVEARETVRFDTRGF